MPLESPVYIKFTRAKVKLEQAAIELAIAEYLQRRGYTVSGDVELRNFDKFHCGPTVYEAQVEVENSEPPAKPASAPDLV